MSSYLSTKEWGSFKAFIDHLLELPMSTEQKLLHLEKHIEGQEDLFNGLQHLLLKNTEMPVEEHTKSVVAEEEQGQTVEMPSALCVGSYRLCEEIGRGGSSIVYRAERVEGGFEQEVAIKVLHDKHSMLDRFQREQQLLASLSHPNIAQLYDGGVTESGEPYFVMEYVRGEAIHHYCDRHNLSINERLQLILQVINALAFSHKNLIIHRDVKPSNIFVTQHGQVKLLDFGIAKFIDHDASMQLTRTGEQVLTPGFASPEQLQGKPVSLATDIYQLGLVTYELLTGKQAYRDQAENFWKISTLMRDHLPTKPSIVVTRLVTSMQVENTDKNLLVTDNGGLVTDDGIEKYNEVLSLLRRSTLTKMKKQLQGDLDVFLLKMLRNEPEQRYSSMESVKTDLEAYFESRPLLAQKKNWRYYSKKFVKRNWKWLAGGMFTFVLLLAYAGTVSWQSRKIELALNQTQQESLKAQQVAAFLSNIFNAVDPNVESLEQISAKKLLDTAEDKIKDELGDTLEFKADILTLLSDIYSFRGDFNKSIALTQQSIEILRDLGADKNFDLAYNLMRLANDYGYASIEVDSAFNALDESFSIYRSSKEPFTVKQEINYAWSLSVYGKMLRLQGEFEKSNQYMFQALHLLEKHKLEKNDVMLFTLNILASNYQNLGDNQQAKYYFEQAINFQESISDTESLTYSALLSNFSLILIREEKFLEAEANFKKIIPLQKKLVGDKNHSYATANKMLGFSFYQQGALHKAEKQFTEVLAIEKEILENSSAHIAGSYLLLGQVYQDLGEYDVSEKLYKQALDIYQTKSNNNWIGQALHFDAFLLFLRGNNEQAMTLYEKALDLMSESGRRVDNVRVGYAQVLLAVGQLDKAQALLEKALIGRKSSLQVETHSQVLEVKMLLGLTLLQQGEPASARVFLADSVTSLEGKPFHQVAHRQKLLLAARQALNKLSQ